jgi:hypothetical protein
LTRRGREGPAADLDPRARWSVKITCPHCGFIQRVERRRCAARTCTRCRGRLADPIASVAARRP